MAYDLFLRTQIDKNYARGDEPTQKRSPLASLMSFGVAGLVLFLPAYQRHKEISEYRTRFATDLPAPIGPHRSYAERRLRTTVEMPTIPMRDFDYSQRQTG